MTKKELAKAISEELGITSVLALQAVQRVFDGITETLVEQGASNSAISECLRSENASPGRPATPALAKT